MSWHMTIVVCATTISAAVAILASFWLNIPQNWEASLQAGTPAFVCILAYLAPRVWGRLRATRRVPLTGFPEPFAALFAVRRVWGPSLDSLKETISLAEQRIEDAQGRLGSAIQNQETPLNQIFWMGYKAIQTARAIHSLCENGYADQAYASCRVVMELEVNIFFIMTGCDPEEICKRYAVWDNAKFYDYVRKNKGNLDISEEEWHDMDVHYQNDKQEYEAKGENIHSRDGWAITWKKGENGKTERVRAGNVVERAEVAMMRLIDEADSIYGIWLDKWDHVNETIHNRPRTLWMGRSSTKEDTMVTGASNVGLRDPIEDVARMMLNISSAISNRIPAERTETSETLGDKTVEASAETIRLLGDVPVEVNPWWQRQVRDGEQP